jgi:hypothetical protein
MAREPGDILTCRDNQLQTLQGMWFCSNSSQACYQVIVLTRYNLALPRKVCLFVGDKYTGGKVPLYS